MSRCDPLGPLLTLVFALVTPLQAAAQDVQRNFPAGALRGELVVTTPPDVLLNGVPKRLAPGSRIRSGNNMLVMSGAIIGRTLKVNYTIDTYGLIKDVWLLREEEAARLPWPKTADEAARWSFDAFAQTWTKP